MDVLQYSDHLSFWIRGRTWTFILLLCGLSFVQTPYNAPRACRVTGVKRNAECQMNEHARNRAHSPGLSGSCFTYPKRLPCTGQETWCGETPLRTNKRDTRRETNVFIYIFLIPFSWFCIPFSRNAKRHLEDKTKKKKIEKTERRALRQEWKMMSKMIRPRLTCRRGQ